LARRAERRGFVGGKRLGGALRRQRKSRLIFRKSDLWCAKRDWTGTPWKTTFCGGKRHSGY